MADNKNGNGTVPNNKTPGAGNLYAINLPTFSKRLKVLYAHWNQHKNDFWGSSEALSIATLPASDDLRYLKSSALNIWLLGFEFPETIMVFTRKQMHILCSQKKASLLAVVKSAAKEAVGLDVVFHIKAKNDDGAALMDAIFRAIYALSVEDVPVVGHIAKEAPEGKLLEAWSAKLRDPKIQLTDITSGLSDLFAVKDETEIKFIKKVASLSASVLEDYMVPKLESIIDEEKKVTHSSLMDDAEKVIVEPSKINGMKASNIDISYPPIFQSGGQFDLKPSAASNDEKLYYDSGSVIICAIGSRYTSYCSNVARTILIDATSTQSKAYEVLLKAHEAAISALKPGNKTSDVYRAALSFVQKNAPDLEPNFTKSAGTGIGLEFRESGLTLNSKNEKVLKENMVFNVSIGFQNLHADINKPKSQNFSLLLADTVIVKPKPEVVTSKSSKALKDVAYSFNDGEDGEETLKVKSNVSAAEAPLSKAALRSDNQKMSKEELRRQHQAELARQKNEETARRLAGGGTSTGDSRGSARSSSELTAYKTVNELPVHRELMIQIDQKNEAVLLPINGSMVPFHVATIRTASSQQHTNRNAYIRIIFNIPGTPFNPHDSNTLKYQNSIYLKEVFMRSKDPRHSNEVVQLIKTLRRQVMSRESEKAERATLVSQEKLVLAGNKFKPIRLSDLWIRPVFGGRGRTLTGSLNILYTSNCILYPLSINIVTFLLTSPTVHRTLEAHTNGFRFSTSRADERVDIMFGNIKHAFFQPADKEMITLIHLHLHNHIMVGTKKTKDVQFYVEVMDVVQTLGGSKRSAYDSDEIEEEQRERNRKNKINMDFQSFVNRVHDLWAQPQFKGLDLEFDLPLRDLGFHGVPYQASAFIIPTSSCLVELIETPFLVITLSEIEIVNLERVGLGQKNFDMAIVFKDFKRDVMRIDSIPSTSLDGIKEWLDTTDLKYYESRLNLNWRPILKTIIDDPKAFLEDGGWEFLNLEASDSDSDQHSEESDRVYEPSDAEPESESSTEDSDSKSLVESDDADDDDDGEDSEAESEEEKGKTWEELEREASNADKEMNESDSEEERKRRKMKAFGKSRGAGSSSSSSITKRPKFR